MLQLHHSIILHLRLRRCSVAVTDTVRTLCLQACTSEVLAFIDPLEELTRVEVSRIQKAEVERAALNERLLQLKRRAASVE